MCAAPTSPAAPAASSPGQGPACPRRAGARQVPRAAAGGRRGRRERPDLRRGRSGPPEHHEPADHRAGRRRRAAPAGYQPAARHLAARYRRAAGAGHLHARGRDQLLPAARRSRRRTRAGRRSRRGAAARGRPAMIPLAVWEQIIDASGAAPRIEALQPIGVRARQLKVRTLLAGMCLAQADHRPAHLTRVHQALTGLTDDDQRRLGVVADSKHGPHLLTYRQTERTSGLVAAALGKDEPGGLPSQALRAACDDLPEASVPGEFKDASTSLAVDRTDLESFSRPPPARGGDCAGPEASWGHRKNNLLRSEDELFFGYYFSAGIMMREENGPAIPELARRAILSSCRHDPARALVPVLTAMPAAGIPLGDMLADSGYAHRDAGAWALPLRAAGASLVQDLHPHDRGPKGAHHGAIISNGNLYCPCTPRSLTELGPLARGATPETGRRARREDRRTGPLQARQDHPRRRRRLPPRRLPGRHGQDPLPAPAVVDEAGPGPARDPHPARTPPGLLHPADPHRPARGEREDRAKARLPLRRAPPLLRPPHRRRTRLRHRQGPRQQRHQPRLVPPDGPGPADAVHHGAARRPQPAHPRRLERPAARKRPPRRGRAPPEDPAPAPQDTRQPGRAAITHRPRPECPTQT